MFFDKPFDFDRFVRLLIFLAIIVITYFLLDRLSAVLTPFFLAWITAYLFEPIVLLNIKWLKKRIYAVLFTLLVLVVGIIIGLSFIIPIIIQEATTLQVLLSAQLSSMDWPSWISKDIAEQVEESISHLRLDEVMAVEGFTNQAINALNQVWEVFADLIGALGAVFGIISYLLYLVFIMLDYPLVSEGWKQYVPEQYKGKVFMLVDDLEDGMNGYFMAMTKIVACVTILFVIGFKLIGLPFAILLGLTIGLMNYIPYSQLFGIIPAIGLCALHSLETGDNFWILLGLVLLVFTVVQLIQDLYLTPKFMGEFSGFNPAIILLSLSIWGSLLGLIGVIIAIPLTSLLVSYYKRYILDKSR